MYADASHVTAQQDHWSRDQVLRILRFPDVINRTGLSKSAIYQRIREGGFPSPIPLGRRAVGFIEYEIDQHLQRLVDAARGKSNARSDSAGDKQE